MKNTLKYLFGTLLLAGSMVACTPEEFDGMDANGVQQIANYTDKVDISVDQSTNQVTMTLNGAQGVYPYWEIEVGADKKGNMKYERSTVNGYKRIFATAGDYKIRCFIGNRNGISQAAIEKTIHIDKTIVDFGPYLAKLAKGPWYIDNEAQGHLGCGEPGTDGLNWWSATPNDKADWGVYDNVLTFDEQKNYTFDPGAHGTIYANKDVSMWADENVLKDEKGDPIDFNHVVEGIQNTTYDLQVQGSDLYLVLPAKTYFPYIANDEQWNDGLYRIVNIDSKSIELVIDNGNISWHFLLTNSKVAKFNGFTYDQADNIWKNIEVQAGGIYYADGGWAAYPDNGGATFTVSNQENNIVLPLATVSQWQAQFPIHTNVGPGSENMNSATTYDFSCVIRSNKDLPGMTLKLVETGDNGVPGSLGIAYDANAVFAETIPVPGGEDYVFYVTEVQGVDIQDHVLQLVLDFGGNAEGTEVTVKNIVLIDHSKNTELDKLPSDEPEPEPEPEKPQVDWSGENLLAGMPINITQWYAPSWSQIADAPYTVEDGEYTIEYGAAASDQWMAQFTFNNTGITLDPEKSYDFRIKITSSQDHPGVTIKLTQQDDDNTFITEGRHALKAGEETWIELADLKFIVNGEGKGQITDLKMPFDFGGLAEGTEITFSDMHLQEHKGPKAISWDLEGDKNIWLKAQEETREFYYAPGWNAIDAPESEIDGNSYTMVLPTATSDRWQAQWKLNTKLTTADIDPAKTYNVRYTLVSSTDHPGVTFKITEDAGNGATFLTDAQTALVAGEEKTVELIGIQCNATITDPTYMIVIDAGGNPADCEITVKDVIIQEAE